MFLVIGGIGFALASVILIVVVRARRRAQRGKSTRQAEEATRAALQEAQRQDEVIRRQAKEAGRIAAALAAQRQAEETRRKAEEAARVAAAEETQRQTEEIRRQATEAGRIAAALAAQRQAEKTRRKAEEAARVAAAEKTQRQTEEIRRQATEAGRVAAALAVQRQAEETRRHEEEADRDATALEAHREAEDTCYQAEEAARVAAAQEAQRQAEETHRQAEEAARVAATEETQRWAEEIRRQSTEAGRIAAALAVQREAEEAPRQEEEAARIAAAEETQRQAEETRRQTVEVARVAAAEETQRQPEETRRQEEEAARDAAALDAQRQAEDTSAQVEEAERVPTPQDEESSPDYDAEAEEDGRRTGDEGRRTEQERGSLTGADAVTDARAAPPDPLVTDSDTLSIPNAPLSSPPGQSASQIRGPRQYRPTPRVPPGSRRPVPSTNESEARDRALPIEVRFVFERAGFCRVSLLPRRAPEMPVAFAVTGSGNPSELLALQDEWYQDIVLPNLEHFLRNGIEWTGSLPEGRSIRLSLSGHELYVLAPHPELNGFVSAPRLVLGEEHVVLCVVERLLDVRTAIALTGSPDPVLLNSDSGVPPGWAGLRGVLPRRPIAPSPDGNILDALRPLAEVEIALEGGIRIERQAWLSGFPPSIRIRGDASTIDVVTIDGHDATLSPDGDYVSPGWDSPGEHSVWCTSDSRTYAIRSGVEKWESWDAYIWSLGETGAGSTQSHPAICGVLVHPPRVARSGSRAIVATASNSVLIGAGPGEIEICKPRSDLRIGLFVGFPWFDPIWAIPADALHCDKRSAKVQLIGPPKQVAEGAKQASTRLGGRVHRPLVRNRSHQAWCTAILTAGSKGLLTEPSQTEIADLWKAYKRRAKALRGNRR